MARNGCRNSSLEYTPNPRSNPLRPTPNPLRQQCPAIHSFRMKPLQKLHLLPLVAAFDQDQKLLRHPRAHGAGGGSTDPARTTARLPRPTDRSLPTAAERTRLGSGTPASPSEQRPPPSVRCRPGARSNLAVTVLSARGLTHGVFQHAQGRGVGVEFHQRPVRQRRVGDGMTGREVHHHRHLQLP